MAYSVRNENVRDRLNKQLLSAFIRNGISAIAQSMKLKVIGICGIILFALYYLIRFRIIGFSGALGEMLYDLNFAAFIAVFVASVFAFILSQGIPKGYLKFHDNFIRINCCNELGEPPVLSNVKKAGGKSYDYEWTFYCPGIPLSKWNDRQEAIESALNVYLLDIMQGKDHQHVICKVLDGDHELKDMLPWQNKYLSEKDFELVLGEGISGKITVNLDTVPHILVGGATGSGKTVLMRSLLAQSIAKGAYVFIADFKKVDFKQIWHRHCQVITDEDFWLMTLLQIVDEMQTRQEMFQQYDCSNLNEFNEKLNLNLDRYVIGCDEIAELLDTTGASKERKEKIAQIESALSTIARQGRAFGISLILGTQRPSADIIPGQIKNNITYKVCGRADNVLSVIILDNGDAADKIPKDAMGRFLDSNGDMFQAYFFKDNQLQSLLEETVHVRK